MMGFGCLMLVGRYWCVGWGIGVGGSLGGCVMVWNIV